MLLRKEGEYMNKRIVTIMVILVLIIAIVIVVVAVNNNKGKSNNEIQNENNELIEEFVQQTADGTKVNKSEELKKEKKLGDLTFNSIQLTNKNGQTVLLANVTNTGSKATELKEVDIIVLDKEGKEIGKVGGIIIPLQPGQSTQFNSSVQTDYANAYDFRVEETK